MIIFISQYKVSYRYNVTPDKKKKDFRESEDDTPAGSPIVR